MRNNLILILFSLLFALSAVPTVLGGTCDSSTLTPPLNVFGYVFYSNGTKVTGNVSYNISVFYAAANSTLYNSTVGISPGQDPNATYSFFDYVECNSTGGGDLLIVRFNKTAGGLQYVTWSHIITASEESIGQVRVPNLTMYNPPTAAVTGLNATNNGSSEGKVTFRWNRITEDDIAGYTVYYNLSQFTNVSGTTNFTFTTGNYTNVASLTDGTLYWFAVVPRDNDGNENKTISIVNATPQDNLAPAQVVNVSSAGLNSSLNLTWSTVTSNSDGSAIMDLSLYKIYSNKSGSWSLVNTTNLTKYVDTGLTNQVLHYYSISAADDNSNEGQNSSIANGTPSDIPVFSPSVSAGFIIRQNIVMTITGLQLDKVIYNVTNSSASLESSIINAGSNSSVSILLNTTNASIWPHGSNITVAMFANDSRGNVVRQNFSYVIDDLAPSIVNIRPMTELNCPGENCTPQFFDNLTLSFLANASDLNVDKVWYNLSQSSMGTGQLNGTNFMSLSSGITYSHIRGIDMLSNFTTPGDHALRFCVNDTFNRVNCTNWITYVLRVVNTTQAMGFFNKSGERMQFFLENGSFDETMNPILFNYTLRITRGNLTFDIVGFAINQSLMMNMDRTNISVNHSSPMENSARQLGVNVSDFGWFDVASFLPAESLYKFGIITLPKTYFRHFYCNGSAISSATCTNVSQCAETPNIKNHTNVIPTNGACHMPFANGTYLYVDHFSGGFGANDSTAPVVNITSPAAGTYFNRTVNITVSWNITEQYFNTSWLTNGTGTNGTTNLGQQHGSILFNFSADGSYTLTIFANDTVNNIGNTSVLIYVDTTAPNTTASVPSGWQPNDFNVTITPSDNIAVNTTFYGFNTSAMLNSSGSSTINFLVNVTGNNTFFFYSKDNSGNVQNTQNITTLLDKTAPVVNSVTPSAGSSTSADSNITAVFNETTMNRTISSSNINVKSLNTSENFTGNFSFNTSSQVLFIPAVRLPFDNVIQVNISGIKDLAGNTMNPYVWNFTIASLDTDGDGNPDYNETDADNDAINDTNDFLIGSSNNVRSNFAVNLSINGSSNLSQLFNGTYPMEIRSSGDAVVIFNYTFTNSTKIILPNITVKRDENASLGSIIIRGLPQATGTKSVRLTNVTRTQGICIKDSGNVQSVTDISGNCTGSQETFVSCPGTKGQYSCTYNATANVMLVSGLNHSGVQQANDTVAPNVTAYSPTTTTTTTTTLTVTTDENATCRYATSANTAYQSMTNNFTNTDTSHTASVSTSSTATHTFYVRCADQYNNTMSADYSASISATIASSSSSSSSSSGGSGAGTANATAAAIIKTSRTWASISAKEQQTFTISSSGIAISKIAFTLSDNAVNAQLTVEQFASKPASVTAAPSPVYKYLSITPSNMIPSDVKIEFTVPKSWLNTNSLVSGNIALFRYVDSNWVELDTVFLSEDSAAVKLYGVSPGFSFFAIGKNSRAVAPATAPPTGQQSNATQPNVTSPTQEAQQQETQGNQTDATAQDKKPSIPKTEKQKNIELTIWAIFSIVVLAVVLYIYFKSHEIMPDSKDSKHQGTAKPAAKQPAAKQAHAKASTALGVDTVVHDEILKAKKELQDYISKHSKKGFSLDIIKTKLVQHGWHPEDIEHAASELNLEVRKADKQFDNKQKARKR